MERSGAGTCPPLPELRVRWASQAPVLASGATVRRLLGRAAAQARRRPLLAHLAGRSGELHIGLGRPFAVAAFTPPGGGLLFALGVVPGGHQDSLTPLAFADEVPVVFQPWCAVPPAAAMSAALAYAGDDLELPTAGLSWRRQLAGEPALCHPVGDGVPAWARAGTPGTLP